MNFKLNSLSWSLVFAVSGLFVCFTEQTPALMAEERIPWQQTAPPGPPLSPEEALAKMQVDDGFHVELVAAEPSIQNPIAMAFDDRGRIYITESFEYPRLEGGPGRDRIKILEDKDGDGIAETVTIFAEGLNIPSGIAVGHGGVWVANAPDILFLEDTDGDDKADKTTVVVTGFGRRDTHELPNALTWGPDGALYGLNGVFNPSKVVQNGKTFEFTCAMFRIDPRTHEFSLFCEGTSNPWGIAFDHEGSAFVSACVIDHLWHFTESAYYLRQGGPYPPNTFYAESIVEHKHQMAAYCGIEFFDSDAYPEAYNNKLYMGNIHGGCINSDSIQRNGATYRGTGNPDFMTANDAWFMPVAQKVGPDGCLYVLDWYDRYHCYQDATADPAGVDRAHGRLYRVVYGERSKPRVVDFGGLSNSELVNVLQDPNIYNRQRAQLQLQQRRAAQDTETAKALKELVMNPEVALKFRLHGLWSLLGSEGLEQDFLETLTRSEQPELRAWGIRIIGNHRSVLEPAIASVQRLAADPDPRVRVEVSVAAAKLARVDRNARLGSKESTSQESGGELGAAFNIEQQLAVLSHSEPDPILPRVVWQNMLPNISGERDRILEAMCQSEGSGLVIELASRFVSLLLAQVRPDLSGSDDASSLQVVLKLVDHFSSQEPALAARLLDELLNRIRQREIGIQFAESSLKDFQSRIAEKDYAGVTSESPSELSFDTGLGKWRFSLLQLGVMTADPASVQLAESLLENESFPASARLQLVRASLVSVPALLDSAVTAVVESLAKRSPIDAAYRDSVLSLGIGRLTRDQATQVCKKVHLMDPTAQAMLAELLCQRSETLVPLLTELAVGNLRKELISPNRVRLLAENTSEDVKSLVGKVWGTINPESSEERELVVQQAQELLRSGVRGNPEKGWLVFDRTCGQCHAMHGRGFEVGPNITSNGRGAFDQLLISVFHPSLVIGEAYQSVTIRTVDDEILTGLLVERTDQRTVLKLQGGLEQVILNEEIDQFKRDTKSLMPEGLEKQLSDQEMADLFALLTLESAPDANENRTISGTPASLHGSAE